MRAELFLGWALVAAGLAGCTAQLPDEGGAPAPAAPPPTPPTEGPPPAPPAPATAGFAAYVSPEDGWRIEHPAGWAQTSLAGITVFASPGNSPERPGASINVAVTSAGAATLTESVDTTLAVLPRIMTDFQLMESRTDTLGGAEAHRWSYTARQGEFTLRLTQVLALHDGKAFVVTFGSTRDRAADFAAVWGTVQASFQFTGLAVPVPASGAAA